MLMASKEQEPGSDALLDPQVLARLEALPEPETEDRGERVEDPGEPDAPDQ